MRAALVQLNASDDPAANLPVTINLIRQAVSSGAEFVLTPEVTNCVSGSRIHQQSVLQNQRDDQTLLALRALTGELGIWLLIGSLALKTDDPGQRFVNRSFMIGPDGQIAAQYDKIHMFDAQISDAESYRESAGYQPGSTAMLATTDLGKVGMTICYDVRFPYLYRALARAGAQILTVPAVFSVVTGAAHWETLLRARAIETGCFVLAPAQTGTHPATSGKPRQSWGHSLAIAPWGEVLADAGTKTGVTILDLDLTDVDAARRRVPSLNHDRDFKGPE